ncbi:hypothetical protein CANCADRAFT_26695 [Tortispora caseinolytica NRRL Y-17796]|uniref:U3 small nucleolar RNA-associated protein 15 C-terminal domain-containing protein n=1 Tax=Tortispora caseinolytica NRRL Y-17796 TaxID=767744 RepID=A0A1E4TH28_9ASCO|nr:hypothetical protein CANCADRAFT_26695 [Tortispora caseinolytica NRRL Y-17796]
MSTPLQRILPAKTPHIAAQLTPEQKKWKEYRDTVIYREHAAISHIHFSPVAPHDFAITSSTRIQIVSGRTRQITKTIAKFKETVYSGEFRADGRLICASDASGQVQVFDATTRSSLLSLHPTNYPTQVCRFHPSRNATLLTGSDDRILRLYDISTLNDDPIAVFTGHEDYVRAACFPDPSSNIVVSGSYDGTVRVWDSRGDGLVLNQGEPIESIVALSPNVVAVASGPTIKILDLISGKSVKTLTNFQKTVMDLTVLPDGLMAGGLDGHVKVFDSQWNVVNGWKFGGPVLSVGMSPDMKHVVTGQLSGLVTVRSIKAKKLPPQATVKSGAYERLVRGAKYSGDAGSIIVENEKKKPKQNLSERLIHQFRYGDALVSSLGPGISNETTAMVLAALRERGKIRVALSGRDDSLLEPLMRWCISALSDARYYELAIDWIGVVLDMYPALIAQSPLLEQLLRELEGKVSQEINRSRDAVRIEGMLRMLS